MAARGLSTKVPVVAVSGPSGVGKTRLLARLVAELTTRGVRVGILKHTGHAHPFDVPGKDTDVLRRAGAVAAAIEGPAGMAYFGPPVGGARALLRLLPPVDLVLAEGWKREPLPRVEVHRHAVSREFLCARDRRVFAVVTDTPPPRPVRVFGPDEVNALADLLCRRYALASPRRGRARLRVRPRVSRVPAEGSERTIALGRREPMAKTTNRRSGGRGGARSTGRVGARGTGRGGRSGARGGRTGTKSRSAAGRKGGTTTLRRRGPEFYSEIGRKGGKSRGRAKSRRTASARRGGGRRSSGAGRTRSSRGGGSRSRGTSR